MAKARGTLDNREIAIAAVFALVLILAMRYLYASGAYGALYLCPAILLVFVLVFLAFDVWKRLR